MKSRKNSPVTEFAILLALLLPIKASQADNFTTSVYQIYSAPSQTWNDAIWQPGLVSPTAGNSYEVLSGGLIRNSFDGGIQTFPGDSLILDPGSRIRATGWSGATLNFPGVDGNPGLILNGGKLQAGPGDGDQVFTIGGWMSVVANSGIDQGWGSPGLVIIAQITGSGNLVVMNGSRRRAVDIQSADNPYTGNWLVMRGWLKGTGNGSLGTGNITVANGASFEVGYDIQSPGTLTLLGSNSVMILHQDCQFSVVTINGVTLASGTYTYDQLVALFPGNVADGGSGSITVPALNSLRNDPTATDGDQPADLSSTAPSLAADDSADPSDVGDGSDPTTDMISVAPAVSTLAVTDTISVALAVTTLAVTDMTAPAIVSAEMVSANSSSQITIRWNSSTDTGGSGVAGYSVYRNGVLAGRTTATSYVDTGLSPSTQYCYTVAALDNAGNSSSGSAQACVVTASLADTIAPSISSAVMVTVNSSTQITIRWNSSTDTGGSGVAGYRVYHNGLLAGTTTATSYADSGLSPSTQYCYTVVAYDAAGNNAPGSAQACATTSGSVSNPPSNVISSDRLVSWQGHVGVAGGIPNVTTIYSNIAAGASLATVQAALNSCPSNQVVKLAAGSYSWSADLDWKDVGNGVVLRGAGTNTVITFSNGRIYMRAHFSESALSVDANLSADAVKGSNTLTLASVPSWVTVGGLIAVDELDDTNFVASGGTNGGESYRGTTGNGARGLAQLNRVLAKTATTITLETPLYYGFKTSQVAQIFQPAFNPSTDTPRYRCGIEDLKITATYSGDIEFLYMELCDSCWVKNVEVDNQPGKGGVYLWGCYRCEVRHCNVHDSHLQDAGHGYAYSLYNWSCANLIEDNILYHLHVGANVNFGSSGNVMAYNYEFGGITSGGAQTVSMSTHGVHCYMNLWEGNYSEEKVLGDWVHGSASHNTVFRCRVTGQNGSGDQRCCVSIEYYNRYWNIVGNVLGTTGLQNKYMGDSTSASEGSQGNIFKVGGVVNINDDYSIHDANSYTNGSFILIHGNWDSVQNQVTWNPLVASHTLTNSYYLSGKPSYFGSLNWPPFDSANPATANVTSIPAGYRYVTGRDPS